MTIQCTIYPCSLDFNGFHVVSDVKFFPAVRLPPSLISKANNFSSCSWKLSDLPFKLQWRWTHWRNKLTKTHHHWKRLWSLLLTNHVESMHHSTSPIIKSERAKDRKDKIQKWFQDEKKDAQYFFNHLSPLLRLGSSGHAESSPRSRTQGANCDSSKAIQIFSELCSSNGSQLYRKDSWSWLTEDWRTSFRLIKIW